MVRKLRYKFIALTMLCVVIVLIMVVTVLNVVNMYCIDTMTSDILRKIADNNGNYPDFLENPDLNKIGFGFKMTENNKFDSSYFIVRTDSTGKVYQHDIDHIGSVTVEEAEEYVKMVMDKASSGRIENYKYVYREKENGKIFVFLDCGLQYQIFGAYVLFSCYISGLSLFLIFIFVVIISHRAISPTVNAIKQQKTFITNAGHELKTPLAIIMANADVLELMYEKNEWTESIRNQSLRMNDLIKSMLTLAKFESEKRKIQFTYFDASNTVKTAAEPFVTAAKNKNNDFEISAGENIRIKGDEAAYRQLVSIFLDNAVKYTTDGGKISVILSENDKNIKLEVSNTCDNMPSADDMNKLFNRFYRADSSRSRDTGGFGIGLSIAQSIVNAHNGKIYAENRNGNVICFTAVVGKHKS